MARAKIDEEKLMELVKANTPVSEIAEKLGIDSPAYAKAKVKDAIAKINAAEYPGLFVGRGGSGTASKVQPKLSKKGSLNLSKKLLESWGIMPAAGTQLEMKVSRDKTKITLQLGEDSGD